MPIVAVISALVALVWGAVVARRGSLVVGCGVFLIVGYVLGHDFWHANVGPLPLTLDRAVFAGLVVALIVQWRLGRLEIDRPVGGDWLLLTLVAVLTLSTFLAGQPEFYDAPSRWGRLAFSVVLPAILYGIARHASFTRRQWQWVLAGLVVLGTYLALLAFCEVAGAWSLVFPRYIADPESGIHFGRARGPNLNSASLGIYLTACLWCGWTLARQLRHRAQQLLIFATLPLMALGVFVTYTRSTWLGLAVSGLVVAAIQMPRHWRLPALATMLVGILTIASVSWTNIVGLQREGSAAESHHSIDQRRSFAYVSWQMFRDRPIFGVGFGRFYDRKLPYLSDRRQEVELDSIRSLQHHNTLLSLLTEAGMVGLAACVALLAAWTRYAWRLAKDTAGPPWVRGQGVLMLALLSSYLCSAAFHDLTLIPPQQWLLFLFASLTTRLWQHEAASRKFARHSTKTAESPVSPTDCFPSSGQHGASTVDLFGMRICPVTMRETVAQLLTWCNEARDVACRYVVTPNVDHAVMFRHRADLRAAYARASLVLADGVPIVLAAKLLGKPLTERVAGSDLVPRLFDAARRPLRVFLLGAAPGVADQAAERIRRQWSDVEVVGTYSPPLDFEHDEAENAQILTAVNHARPDLLIIGLGAPKQERWIHRHHRELSAKVALCVGATIDFLAGHRRRSPRWMRRVGLEWLHRVYCEPRRLAGRYARDACLFPKLVWHEWRGMRK